LCSTPGGTCAGGSGVCLALPNGPNVCARPCSVIGDGSECSAREACSEFGGGVCIPAGTCGDGVISGFERCDGDVIHRDQSCAELGLGEGTPSCSDTCTVTGCVAPFEDPCLGPSSLVVNDFEPTLLGPLTSTSGAASSCGGASTAERIFTFVAPADGTLFVRGEIGVWVRGICGADSSEVGCVAADEDLVIELTAGEAVFVGVEVSAVTTTSLLAGFFETVALPRSCTEILVGDPAAASGGFVIDTDGNGPTPSVAVACDMDFDGGGWTRIMATRRLGPDLLAEGGTDGDGPSRLSLDNALALATVSTEVHLRTAGAPDDGFRSRPGSLPISSLRQGRSLQFGSLSDLVGSALRIAQSRCIFAPPPPGDYPAILRCEATIDGDTSHWSPMGGPDDIEVWLRDAPIPQTCGDVEGLLQGEPAGQFVVGAGYRLCDPAFVDEVEPNTDPGQAQLFEASAGEVTISGTASDVDVFLFHNDTAVRRTVTASVLGAQDLASCGATRIELLSGGTTAATEGNPECVQATIEVGPGETVTVTVPARTADEPYNLRLTSTEVDVCGNGVVGPGEGCDEPGAVFCTPGCEVVQGFRCTGANACAPVIACDRGLSERPFSAVGGPGVNVGGGSFTSATVEVFASAVTLSQIAVTIDIGNAAVGDLNIGLTSPNGDFITLANRRGGDGDAFSNTVFSIDCPPIASGTAPFSTGCFSPDTSFDGVFGESFSGVWTLGIVDFAAPNDIDIRSWRLDFCGLPG